MSLNAQPQASLHIAGRFVEGEGRALDVLYPYTGERIASLQEASVEQVAHACAIAAQAQPAWAALAPSDRGRVLTRAAAIIRDRNAELSRLETLDTGKPIQETLVADWESGAQALEFFGGLAASLTGQMIPLGQDWAYTRREALGVCAGIGAWNYPSQIACWKAAPALVMGNAMVFKPSEETPLGALKLAEILSEAGLPDGVFNVVQGGGDVGAALTTDPHVAKVSLTGSVPTGRRVYAAAAEGMRHVTMELGGKSPLIVFEDASLEDAVSAAMLANFYSSGQICSNGTRVFLQEGIREMFLDRLAERAPYPHGRSAGPRHPARPHRQRAAGRQDPHHDRGRRAGRRKAAVRRRGRGGVHPAHRFRGRDRRHDHHPRRDFRPGDDGADLL